MSLRHVSVTLPAGVTLLAVAAPAAGQTSFQFEQPPALAAGPQPRALAAGDLDGDAAVDLAVAGGEPDALRVFFSDGAGGFGAPLELTGFDSVNLRDVVIADMNGDAHADVVLTFRGSVVPSVDSGVVVLLNDGAGSFTGTGLEVTCITALDSSVADFNGDLVPDVASTSDFCQQVSVQLGTGGGALGPHVEYGAGYTSRGNAVADLDDDGHLDVMYANATPLLTVLRGSGDGTFSFSFADAQEIGDLPQAVYAADLDLDGRPDVLTANRYSDDVTVLYNEGAMSFTRVDVPAGSEAMAAAVADLDRDGAPDLAVGNGAGAALTLRRHDGLRFFAAPQTVPLAGPVSDVIAADLDGDGADDLAAVSDGAGTLSVLLNRTPAATPGDVDGDGLVGTDDLLALLGAWGPCEIGSPCPADADHDGLVGVTDFLILLGNWG